MEKKLIISAVITLVGVLLLHNVDPTNHSKWDILCMIIGTPMVVIGGLVTVIVFFRYFKKHSNEN